MLMNMKPASCIGQDANGNTRWHIDAATLAVLEKVFMLDQFPNVETRKQLGAELGVSTRQIQVWFQNRRQRERKNRSGLGMSNSGLEGIMHSSQATPVSSCDDITTVLFEFSVGKKDDQSLCALPLAPMPRMNSPTSTTSGGSIPSTPGGSSESLPLTMAVEAAPARDFCRPDPNRCLSPPSPMDEQPLARPDSLLASALPRPAWPGGTASISSWTPPPSSVPTKGGPAPPPRQLPGALPQVPPPNVAAKLAQACQTSLIGRTLQDYGGIVQVITEPRSPFHVLSVSPGWERLSGYSRDEVLGRPLKMLQGSQTEPEMIALLMRSVHEQRAVSVRITNYTKQGASFVHQLSIEPLRDASGRTQCFQATSLVLRRPGEDDSAEEISMGQLPLLTHDQVPRPPPRPPPPPLHPSTPPSLPPSTLLTLPYFHPGAAAMAVARARRAAAGADALVALVAQHLPLPPPPPSPRRPNRRVRLRIRRIGSSLHGHRRRAAAAAQGTCFLNQAADGVRVRFARRVAGEGASAIVGRRLE